MIQSGDPWIESMVEILRKNRNERTAHENSLVPLQGFTLDRGAALYRNAVCSGWALQSRQNPLAATRTVLVLQDVGLRKTTHTIQACIECVFNKDFTGLREGGGVQPHPTRTKTVPEIVHRPFGPAAASCGEGACDR